MHNRAVIFLASMVPVRRISDTVCTQDSKRNEFGWEDYSVLFIYCFPSSSTPRWKRLAQSRRRKRLTHRNCLLKSSFSSSSSQLSSHRCVVPLGTSVSSWAQSTTDQPTPGNVPRNLTHPQQGNLRTHHLPQGWLGPDCWGLWMSALDLVRCFVLAAASSWAPMILLKPC
jgi:hypothetical protein